MEFTHLFVKVHGLVAVLELDVLARHERPVFRLDFLEGGGGAVFGFVLDFLRLPLVVGAADFRDVLGAELGVFLFEGFAHLAQVHKEHFAFAAPVLAHGIADLDFAGGLVVVQNPERHADVGGVEHVAGQNEDCLDLVVLQKFLADLPFVAFAAERTVAEQKARYAVFGEFRENVQNPAVVRVTRGRHGVAFPARVIEEFVFGTPRFLVERRGRHDKVGFQILVLVFGKGVGGFVAQVAGDAADGEVHLRKFIRGAGVFLAIYGDFALVAVVRLDKLHALHEHAARTAAGVVNLAAVGFNHFGDETDNCLGCIEFALALAFGDGELAEEIFIDAANDILFLVFDGVDAVDVADERREFCGVELQAREIVVGERPAQRLVLLFDVRKRGVDQERNITLAGMLDDKAPAGSFFQIKDVVLVVELGHFHVFLAAGGDELFALFLELVACKLQEDKRKHHVLVFGGFHAAAQLVRRLPERGLYGLFGDGFLFCGRRLRRS